MPDKVSVWVVKPKGRPFQLQWVDPMSGKRKTRSAGTTTKRDANRAAALLESELRNGTYQDTSRVTWGEFRERYDQEQLSGLANETAYKVYGVFAAVERVLGFTSESPLRELTADRISHHQAQLRKSGLAESTIAGHTAHLQAALRWAANIGMLPKAPKLTKVKRAKTGGKLMKGRPITGEEFDRMLDKAESVVGAAAAESWRHYLRGLWWSGLRLEESLNLYWDRQDRLCVDLSGRRPMLRIPAECEKGNQDRLLPIAPEFAQFLSETPARERQGRVFPLRATRRHREALTKGRVSRVLGLIGKAAVVKVNTDPKSGRVKFASAHDLRRSFGERWSTRVMPQVLMELMRHESIETTLRYYVGRNAETTADAAWAAFEQRNDAALNAALNTGEPCSPMPGQQGATSDWPAGV